MSHQLKHEYLSVIRERYKRLRHALGIPGSTKFKVALPEWLEYDEHPALHEVPELRQKLKDVSRPQLDRLLRPYRIGTQHGLGIKNQIPIHAKDWNVTEPSQQAQADTVAHQRSWLAHRTSEI